MRIWCGKCGRMFYGIHGWRGHLPCVVKTDVPPDCTCMTTGKGGCSVHRGKR